MNPKEVRIAIAGSFGYMDIGDEAMLTEDLRFLKEDLEIPAKQIYLIGQQPNYVAEYHKHPITRCFSSQWMEANWWHLRRQRRTLHRTRRLARRLLGLDNPAHYPELDSTLRACHAALITGGGTINTRDEAGYSIRRMHRLVDHFKSCGLPVFMSGQTIGPLGIDAEHDQLAREILAQVDVLTVRDQDHSRNCLERLGCKPNVLLETFDDAYTLEYASAQLPEDTLEFLSQDVTIAVNTTEYTGNLPEQQAFIAKLCERLIVDRNRQIVLISHAPQDLLNHRKIRERLTGTLRQRVHLPDTRHWSGSMLKQLISRCELAIGGRYHFIVFAGTSNTPFVGMCGNEYSFIKQHGFAAALELEHFILDPAQSWNADLLWSKIDQASTTRLDLADRFSRPSASMRLLEQWLKDLQ